MNTKQMLLEKQDALNAKDIVIKQKQETTPLPREYGNTRNQSL
jgi:hypothetical protein